MTSLNSTQKTTIINTWSLVYETPAESGTTILLEFFKRYPHNQQKFAAFKDISLDLLKDHQGFVTHSTRIITTINEAVLTLQNSTEDYTVDLEILWRKIAESHERRNITKASFNELRVILGEILTNVCSLDEEQQLAWTIFLDEIYQIVFKQLSQ